MDKQLPNIQDILHLPLFSKENDKESFIRSLVLSILTNISIENNNLNTTVGNEIPNACPNKSLNASPNNNDSCNEMMKSYLSCHINPIDILHYESNNPIFLQSIHQLNTLEDYIKLLSNIKNEKMELTHLDLMYLLQLIQYRIIMVSLFDSL